MGRMQLVTTGLAAGRLGDGSTEGRRPTRYMEKKAWHPNEGRGIGSGSRSSPGHCGPFAGHDNAIGDKVQKRQRARPALCKIVTVGFVATVPELFSRGTPLLRFRVAVNGGRTDSNDDRVTAFYTVQVWGNSASKLQPYIRKGDRIAVSGSQSINEWTDRSGGARTDIQINVDYGGIELLGSHKAESEESEKEIPF